MSPDTNIIVTPTEQTQEGTRTITGMYSNVGSQRHANPAFEK